MNNQNSNHSLTSRLITGLIAFAGCLLIPAVVTAVLGMSRLTLTRGDGLVTARLDHFVFFVVPWKTETLHDVRTVTSEVTQGERIKPKPGERDRNRHAMDNGALTLQGAAGSIEAAVAPSVLRDAQGVVKGFLTDPGQISSRQFLMANRLFGWGFGIPMTLLALTYTIGAVLWLPAKLFLPPELFNRLK